MVLTKKQKKKKKKKKFYTFLFSIKCLKPSNFFAFSFPLNPHFFLSLKFGSSIKTGIFND